MLSYSQQVALRFALRTLRLKEIFLISILAWMVAMQL